MNGAVHGRLGVSPEAIAEFCKRWNVSEFGLFGSAVREDFRRDSDVDVLLTFPDGRSPEIHDLVVMEDELQALFGRKVDLVEKRLIGPNPFRRYNILADHQVLYPEPELPGDVIREGPARFDRDLGYVWDVVQAGRKIVDILRRDDVDDRLSRLAIERLLGIVGEAARGLTAEFRAAHPEIPWHEFIADWKKEDEIWNIALAAVPTLIEQLESLVATPPSEPQG